MKKLYLLLLLSLPIVVFGQYSIKDIKHTPVTIDTTQGLISWVDTLNLRVRADKCFRFITKKHPIEVEIEVQGVINPLIVKGHTDTSYYIPSPYRIWVDSKSVISFIKSQ